MEAQRLPLFPLDLVLFPGTHLPLHIFEPRYRLMVRRCNGSNSPFGVALLGSGTSTGGSAAVEPSLIGTSARIVAVQGLPDGRSFVVTEGERRFSIENVVRDAEPYLVGDVRWLDEIDGVDAPAVAAETAEMFESYLLAANAVTAESGGEGSADTPIAELAPGPLSYHIAASLPGTNLDRQRLLESATAADRLRLEQRTLRREIELMQELLVRLRARSGGTSLN